MSSKITIFFHFIFSLQILEDKEFKSVIDGKDENFSSWMRYINLARNETEQNLCAFQYNDSVHYRSSKVINPNTELLVWYGKDFLSELGCCIFDSDNSIPIGRPEKLIKFVIESADLNKETGDDVSSAYPHYVNVDTLPAPMAIIEGGFSALKREYVSSNEDECELPSPHTILMERGAKQNVNTPERSKRSKVKESSKLKSIQTKLMTSTNENKIKHVPDDEDADPDFDPGDDQSGELRVSDTNGEESSDKSNEAGYKCEECGQVLRHLQSLKVHMRIHSGEKPFVCDECGKSFRQKSNLSTHKISHSAEKPHQCNQCNKRYRLARQLAVHMRLHTGERPYVCKDCGKSYYRVESLRNHCNDKHNDSKTLHECDQCDAKYYYPSKLKVHQRVHTGERPFTCNYCKKQFRRADDLIMHERIHTGEKPYGCSECGWRFVSSSKFICYKLGNVAELCNIIR